MGRPGGVLVVGTPATFVGSVEGRSVGEVTALSYQIWLMPAGQNAPRVISLSSSGREAHRMTKSFLVRMPDETFDALKAVSDLDGTSMNQLAVTGSSGPCSTTASASVTEIVDDARVRYAEVLDKLKDM